MFISAIFRTYVFEDVLRRHLLSKGWKLMHVMNITDIDDKIIQRSMETGRGHSRPTRRPYTEAFFEDCAKLRIERPDVITPATDYIPEMIELVEPAARSGLCLSRRRFDLLPHFAVSRPTAGCRVSTDGN